MRHSASYTLTVICFSALFLASCTATVTEEATSADNKKIYGIDCSGKAIPMSVCYSKAAQLCPRGYRIIAPEAQTVPVTRVGQVIGLSIPGVKKGITIKCK